MSRTKVTHLIQGCPVPGDGESIVDDTLAYMLSEKVVGWSPKTLVLNTFESPALMDFLPPQDSNRDEHQPLVIRNPSVQQIYMAVGVAYGRGKMHYNPTTKEPQFASTGNHFITIHVDIASRIIRVMDSLPTVQVLDYVKAAIPTITTNIFGVPTRMMFCAATVSIQPAGSNECAVHVWRNIACSLTSHHEVPAFHGLVVEPEDICRDVFRCVFNEYFV